MVKTDTAYRGLHAVHLKRRRKLGKHLTVLKDKRILMFLEFLLGLSCVKQVNLGQLVGLAVAQKEKGLQLRFESTKSATGVRLLIVSGRKVQRWTVETQEHRFDTVYWLVARITEMAGALGFEVRWNY